MDYNHFASKTWKVRPIFISSTFKDFGEERDHLQNFVFPEIMERLQERLHRLEPIDLRWGVETKSVAEEESKQMLILKVCFGEIYRSRPFLIALLGDRFGWIPPKKRVKKAVHDIGYKGDIINKSITALEIEYGVLNDKSQKKRSRFYFRESLPYDEMPLEVAANYSDRHSKEKDAPIKIEQYEKLKNRIKSPIESPELIDRWRTYKTGWDRINNIVIDLDAFGKMVLEDLWEDIKEETEAYFLEPSPTWMEQERRSLSEFIEGRVRGFKGRKQTLNQFFQFAISEKEEQNILGYCLTGNAGSGKSAIFAKLHSALVKQDILLLSNAAGPGARSTDVDSLLERWIGELCVTLGLKIPQNITEEKSEGNFSANDKNKPNRSEELENTFRRLLFQASEQMRVVVLMDALDQMEQTIRSRYLNWLPAVWPENARLIATGIPGIETESFAKREKMELLELPPLKRITAEKIVAVICKKYHRKLNPEVLDVLLTQEKDGVLALSNPLWLSIAIEELNLVDSDDFANAEKEYEGDGESKLFQLLVDKAKAMPAEVEGLYQWIFKRLEKIFGKEFVKACLGFIAIGRKGWGERELAVLVPEITNEKWIPLNWAAMRRLLRAHLVQSDTGLWRFFHAQIGRSVQSIYLINSIEVETLHDVVVRYLLSLPESNPLRQSESMFHLIYGSQPHITCPLYLGFSKCKEEELFLLQAMTEYLLNGRMDTGENRLNLLISFLNAKHLGPIMKSNILALFNSFIYYLEGKVEIETRLFLSNSLSKESDNLASIPPILDFENLNQYQREKADRHVLSFSNFLANGDLYKRMRAFEKAYQKYTKALEEVDLLSSILPLWNPHEYRAGCYERFGDIEFACGNQEISLEWYHKALDLRLIL